MKKIDKRFRHLPEHKAVRETLRLEAREAAPELKRQALKEYHDSGVQERTEKLVQSERRRFLDFVGKTGIALGLLRSSALLGGLVSTRYSMAATGPLDNKRVVFCYVNSGTVTNSWMPSSASSMNRATQSYAGVADVCHFRQVQATAEGHASTFQAFGAGYGMDTPDVRIANLIGVNSFRKMLYLGAYATQGEPFTDYLKLSSAGGIIDQIPQAYDFAFGGFSAPKPAGLAYQKAFDAQAAALDQMRKKLSAEEFVRYQDHLAAIAKVRSQIEQGSQGSAQCQPNFAPGNGGDLVAAGKAQVEVIIHALQCGITNVASLQVGNNKGYWTSPVSNFDHHGAAHSTGDENHFINMDNWRNQVPAYLIKRLKETIGPDGQPLIQSTVASVVTCMGNGRDHSRPNSPFVLATQMPTFKPGFSTRLDNSAGPGDIMRAIGTGFGLDGQINWSGIQGSNNTLGLV